MWTYTFSCGFWSYSMIFVRTYESALFCIFSQGAKSTVVSPDYERISVLPLVWAKVFFVGSLTQPTKSSTSSCATSIGFISNL